MKLARLSRAKSVKGESADRQARRSRGSRPPVVCRLDLPRATSARIAASVEGAQRRRSRSAAVRPSLLPAGEDARIIGVGGPICCRVVLRAGGRTGSRSAEPPRKVRARRADSGQGLRRRRQLPTTATASRHLADAHARPHRLGWDKSNELRHAIEAQGKPDTVEVSDERVHIALVIGQTPRLAGSMNVEAR